MKLRKICGWVLLIPCGLIICAAIIMGMVQDMGLAGTLTFIGFSCIIFLGLYLVGLFD